MLENQEKALGISRSFEDALVAWPPRLSQFPPPAPEKRVCDATSSLSPILEAELRDGEVHSGRILQLTTISEASVFGGTMQVVAEDEDGGAVCVVVHYFSADQSLSKLHRQFPVGTAISVKHPFFCIFPQGGAAVCCSHPENFAWPMSSATEDDLPPTMEKLLEDKLFNELLRRADETITLSPDDQSGHFWRAEALMGLGRHSDAARGLLKLNTEESKEKSKKVFERVKGVAKGEFDFASMYAVDACGPTRFPCDSFTRIGTHIEIRNTDERGQGVFALQSLQRGELVMACKAECSVFSTEISTMRLCQAPGYDEDGEESTASTLVATKLAASLQRTKSEEAAARLEALLRLSRGKWEHSTSSDEAVLLRLMQVVRTNRFSILGPWEGNIRGTGLWLEASRLNHSCNANCSWTTVGDMLFIRCQREILAGEELCISYCDPMGNFKDRQEFLQGQHGFSCACLRCIGQKDAPEEYTKVLARIRVCEDASPRDFVGILKHRASAYEILSCDDFCSLRQQQVEHAMAACAACCKLKRLEEAGSWMEKAKAAFALLWGSDKKSFQIYARERGAMA
eukprot:TRINITY_DN44069_c0_g1_i1.p1 TRINITY_DN44069_c0_g1~~TRINITY_DN44069_c0_g1_i1.p1  ORF type:complete len:601 (-),score=102.50 TRINITY_DN44069_c0_g1_i1:41-1753(-)